MKKIITILLLTTSLLSFGQGQGPTVLGTYLPVKGTSIKQVWNKNYGSIPVPTFGPNMSWDYSGQFPVPNDTFQIKTFDPYSVAARYHLPYFSSATHGSFIRTGIVDDPIDSLYAFFIIDNGGLHLLGGFNIKTTFDSTLKFSRTQLLVPALCGYGGTTTYDTSKYTDYAKNFGHSGYSCKTRGTTYNEMDGIGYGSLKIPGATYHNVLLARRKYKVIDSVFVDVLHNGNYVFISSIPTNPPTANPIISYNYDYEFIRNNTFGSSYLMHLHGNANDIVNGYYVLPVDFGSISGFVVDSIGGAATIHGEALLYRENSNFSRNDILDKSPLDQNGHYQFDSIPYGEYRIAIRADSLDYPYALTTYCSDSTNWLSAPSVHSTSSTTPVGLIHLQYHPVPSGSGIVHGNISYDSHIRAIDPIPGVDIIVRKNPGGLKNEVKTDGLGNFSLAALDTGNYTMFVDIPGIFMASGCNFHIANGAVIYGYDCMVGTDSVHPFFNQPYNVNEQNRNSNLMSVYPNPFSSSTLIKFNVSERSDVLLEVYNMLGEKIQTLEKTEKGPGIYSYNFNSKKLNYSSGTYLLKLNVGGKTSVLKIIEQ